MAYQDTVELHISEILKDLNQGLSWFEKDDTGKGSIQKKYGAQDYQILVIQKNPKFRDEAGNLFQPAAKVFTLIDDTNVAKESIPVVGPVHTKRPCKEDNKEIKEAMDAFKDL